MAHFAKINLENKVLTVLTLNNSDMTDINGVEEESIGQQYLQTHNHWPAHLWIQTSYNSNFRKNYACGGGTYNKELNAFIAPKPYNSWILNTDTCRWEAPIPMPTDGKAYTWSEETLTWIEIPNN
jgi:hypothetical protein